MGVLMDDLTPAMKQYMTIKNKHKECIVFFRMGDFYETFYEDAKITSKALDIALTKRGIKNSDRAIPLAGIPYHALDSYLSKMIKQGFKIAIVEQMEDPKLAKGVVKRDVVRIITPGTVIEHNLLGDSNNFIASLLPGKDNFGISFVDISTGEFFTTEADNADEAINEMMKYSPSEILLPISLENDKKIISILKENGFYLTYVSDVDFYFENAKNALLKQFNILSIDGLGLKDKELSLSTAGALLLYLIDTQKNSLKHLTSLKYYTNKDFLVMDTTTIKNLELIKNLRENSDKSTLLYVLDRTLTPMGARLLKKFLLKPLLDISKINERLLSVEEFIAKPFIMEEIKDLLKNISDIERLISRVNLGNSNPRDLITLQGSLELVPEIKKLLGEMESSLLIRLKEMEVLKDVTKLIDDS